jgi:hypothetical protein
MNACHRLSVHEACKLRGTITACPDLRKTLQVAGQLIGTRLFRGAKVTLRPLITRP